MDKTEQQNNYGGSLGSTLHKGETLDLFKSELTALVKRVDLSENFNDHWWQFYSR